MAAKFCPECGAPIPQGSGFCPGCGHRIGLAHVSPTTPTEKRTHPFTWFVLICIVLFVLLVLIGSQSSQPTINTAEEVKHVEMARNLIEKLEQESYITKRTCIGNEAHVTSFFWLQMDVEAKRGVLLSLAKLCEAAQSGNRMTILDSMSGRTLATFRGGSVTFY